MSKAVRFYGKDTQFFKSDGTINSGGFLFQYQAGTTTKDDTYTDDTKSTANSNPMTLDSAGRLSQDVYIDQSMKFVLSPSTDADPPTAAIWTIDNISAVDQLWQTLVKSIDYTTLETDNYKLITVDASGAARTITLLAAATAGAGYIQAIKKTDSSSNTVTVDGNSTETLDGATTYVLRVQYDTVFFISDGTNWHLFKAKAEVPLYDSNGNEILTGTATASAVNHINITNAATGNAPTISSTGDDTNVGLIIDTKGTGAITLGSADTTGATLTNGNFTVTAGDLTLTSGNATLTLGNLTLTDGDLTMSSGDLTVTNQDARTATVDYPVTITSTTSDTPAAGIGTGILIRAESADENPSEFGAIEFCATDVLAGSEDTYFDILCRVAGAALTKVYRFIATGAFKAIFTHANTADRTYTLPDYNATLGLVVQRVSTIGDGTVFSTTTTIPVDDTIPQNGEGAEVTTLAITPKSTSHILVIDFFAPVTGNSTAGASHTVAALFQDATADALQVTINTQPTSNTSVLPISFRYIMSAGTTSATTFKIRFGPNAGTGYIGRRGADALFSTTDKWTFQITEYTS